MPVPKKVCEQVPWSKIDSETYWKATKVILDQYYS